MRGRVGIQEVKTTAIKLLTINLLSVVRENVHYFLPRFIEPQVVDAHRNMIRML